MGGMLLRTQKTLNTVKTNVECGTHPQLPKAQRLLLVVPRSGMPVVQIILLVISSQTGQQEANQVNDVHARATRVSKETTCSTTSHSNYQKQIVHEYGAFSLRISTICKSALFTLWLTDLYSAFLSEETQDNACEVSRTVKHTVRDLMDFVSSSMRSSEWTGR